MPPCSWGIRGSPAVPDLSCPWICPWEESRPREGVWGGGRPRQGCGTLGSTCSYEMGNDSSHRGSQLNPTGKVKEPGHLKLFINISCGHYCHRRHLYRPPLNRDPEQVLGQWKWTNGTASPEGRQEHGGLPT